MDHLRTLGGSMEGQSRELPKKKKSAMLQVFFLVLPGVIESLFQILLALVWKSECRWLCGRQIQIQVQIQIQKAGCVVRWKLVPALPYPLQTSSLHGIPNELHKNKKKKNSIFLVIYLLMLHLIDCTCRPRMTCEDARLLAAVARSEQTLGE